MSAPAPEAIVFAQLAVYDNAETAAILRVHTDTLKSIVERGDLRPLGYVKGKRLFSGREIARFLKVQTEVAS